MLARQEGSHEQARAVPGPDGHRSRPRGGLQRSLRPRARSQPPGGARSTAAADEPRYLCAYEVERTDLPMSKQWNDTSDIGRWKPEVRPYTYNKHYLVSERIVSA